MNICCKEIKLNELQDDVLTYHNRCQYVENDWYPDKNGGYYLVHQPHTENWDDKRKREIVSNLRFILSNGGKLFGAYDGEKLIGFSALDGILTGSENQYLELAWFHVSNEYRGKGVQGKSCLAYVLKRQSNTDAGRYILSPARPRKARRHIINWDA